MSLQPDQSSIVRFGTLEANLATGELWKDGHRVKLQEQPFRLLSMLIERKGMLVSREELQEALWHGAEYGEFEQGLNTAVKKVRQALGDSADNPVFVETLPRKGYRFIAPVRWTAPEAVEPAAGELEHPIPTALPGPAPLPMRRQLRWIGAGVAVLGLAAVGGFAFWVSKGSSGRPAISRIEPIPLTSYRGLELDPNFSPDGRQIAFSWDGNREDNYDIYVKTIDSEKLVRLTDDPRNDFSPAWSPDGKRIALGRLVGPSTAAVFLVPANGGPEVKLVESPVRSQLRLETNLAPLRTHSPHAFVAWSPDGKWLAYPGIAPEDEGRADGQLCLNLISVDTGQRRRLTPALKRDGGGDVAPAFSPDGRTLAFLRGSRYWLHLMVQMPLTPDFAPAGPPVQVDPNDDGGTRSLAWLPGGRGLIAAKPWAGGSSNSTGLWLLDPRSKQPRAPFRIAAAGNDVSSVAVSPNGQVAYSSTRLDTNIWQVELTDRGRPAGAPRPFIASTMQDLVPQFSRDGRQIVFVSTRSGSEELWTCRSDGSNPVQLTSMATVGSPAWSPDGSHIVFDSVREGQYDVYSVLASGGTPRRLTKDPASDGVATYSHDGKHIYFGSTRTGINQIWRIDPDGSNPVQITRTGGHMPFESADGRFIYYYKSQGVWRVPPGGGEETGIVSPVFGFLSFAVTPEGIYYIPAKDRSAPGFSIRYYSFASQDSHQVLEINAEPSIGRLAVSPDGRILLWGQTDQSGSDLMLLRRVEIPW